MADSKDFNEEEDLDGPATLSENEGVDEEDLLNAPQRQRHEDKPDPKEVALEGQNEDEEQYIKPEHAEQGPGFSPQSGADESFAPARPHERTLDDLADEEPLPTGVNSSTPKSFRSFQEDDDYPSQIPHLGSQFSSSGVYANREPQRGGGNKLKLGFLALIALLVVAAALYLVKGKSLFKAAQVAPSTAPTIVAPQNTPSPTPSFDRTQYKIRVLNGTLKTGLAGSESAKLKGLGYQIDKTGNATNSAFTSTQVLVKDANNTDLLNTLINDLSSDFSASSGGALPSSDPDDAEIILGAK